MSDKEKGKRGSGSTESNAAKTKADASQSKAEEKRLQHILKTSQKKTKNSSESQPSFSSSSRSSGSSSGSNSEGNSSSQNKSKTSKSKSEGSSQVQEVELEAKPAGLYKRIACIRYVRPMMGCDSWGAGGCPMQRGYYGGYGYCDPYYGFAGEFPLSTRALIIPPRSKALYRPAKQEDFDETDLKEVNVCASLLKIHVSCDEPCCGKTEQLPPAKKPPPPPPPPPKPKKVDKSKLIKKFLNDSKPKPKPPPKKKEPPQKIEKPKKPKSPPPSPEKSKPKPPPQLKEKPKTLPKEEPKPEEKKEEPKPEEKKEEPKPEEKKEEPKPDKKPEPPKAKPPPPPPPKKEKSPSSSASSVKSVQEDFHFGNQGDMEKEHHVHSDAKRRGSSFDAVAERSVQIRSRFGKSDVVAPQRTMTKDVARYKRFSDLNKSNPSTVSRPATGKSSDANVMYYKGAFDPSKSTL